MKFIKTMLIVLIACVISGQSTYAAQTFKDVSTKHSNYTEIEWAVSKGLLKGYSDKTFKPSNFLTEAQFAKIYTRYVSPETLEDVDASEETALVYEYLADSGIQLDGHTDNSAKNKNFTRIKVAKVLYQYHEGQAPATNNVAIDWMYEKGLTNGKGVSSNKYTDFGSNDALKRAHISAFFSRYDKMANADPIDESAIVNTLVKDEFGTNLELVSYDRINLTSADEDEYFIYLRDKSASLIDRATNTYIVATYNAFSGKSTVLKKWSETSEFMFLERVSMSNLEQMIVWTNSGADLALELSVIAANSSDAIVVTPITKTYNNGSFYVEAGKLMIDGDSYRLSNGKLVK